MQIPKNSFSLKGTINVETVTFTDGLVLTYKQFYTLTGKNDYLLTPNLNQTFWLYRVGAILKLYVDLANYENFYRINNRIYKLMLKDDKMQIFKGIKSKGRTKTKNTRIDSIHIPIGEKLELVTRTQYESTNID